MSARAIALATACATACAAIAPIAPEARADAPLWNPGWSRVGVAEASVVIGLGAAVNVFDLVAHAPETPSWTGGGVLFDAGARDALRAPGASGRERAATISDVLVTTLVLAPFADAGANVALAHHDTDAALQLALIDAEAFSVASALVIPMKFLIRRQRPSAYELQCDSPSSRDPASQDCTRASRNESFPSGHSAMSFTAATLICTEHLKLPLYGGAWDAIACATAIAAATTTASLRIVADRHFATDVLAGAAIGILSGWLVPALHMRGGTSAPASRGAVAMPMLMLTGDGAGAMFSLGGALL